MNNLYYNDNIYPAINRMNKNMCNHFTMKVYGIGSVGVTPDIAVIN